MHRVMSNLRQQIEKLTNTPKSIIDANLEGVPIFQGVYRSSKLLREHREMLRVNRYGKPHQGHAEKARRRARIGHLN